MSKDMTSAPTMGAQDWSVSTLRTVAVSLPCSVTMLAIWITGSFSASGKCPCAALRDNYAILWAHDWNRAMEHQQPQLANRPGLAVIGHDASVSAMGEHNARANRVKSYSKCQAPAQPGVGAMLCLDLRLVTCQTTAEA